MRALTLPLFGLLQYTFLLFDDLRKFKIFAHIHCCDIRDGRIPDCREEIFTQFEGVVLACPQ